MPRIWAGLGKNQGSVAVLGRFALRLVTVVVCAALWPDHPLGSRLASTSLVMAAVCVLAAIALRESFRQRQLNRWDEAAAFVAIGLLARVGSP
jgi:hypothetical protein